MWFDLHADIGYDIYQQHLLGNDTRFQDYHLPRLKRDKVMGVCIACYFGNYESWEVMQDCVSFVRRQIEQSDVCFVRSKEDIDTHSGKLMVLLTIEGMYGIQEDVENKIQWLYDQGVRIGSLCWNEENALATGVRGTLTRGLTPKGKDAILKMQSLGMILDVSHLNDQSFYDVMDFDIPVLATHSNARSLCGAMRNLTNDQLTKLKEKEAIIGLNACGSFVDTQKELQDCFHFVKHAQFLVDKVGLEHVGCGFDFMDYYEPEDLMLRDLQSTNDLVNFENALSNVYNKKDIQRIASLNTLEFLKKHL